MVKQIPQPVWPALISALLFMGLVLWIQPTFLVDDYLYLGLSYKENFGIDSFGALFSRMPVTVPMLYLIYSLQKPYLVYLAMSLMFFFRCLGILLISRWLFEAFCGLGVDKERLEGISGKAAPAGTKQTDFNRMIKWSWLLAIVAPFWPGFYEIIYWTAASPYGIGGLLVSGFLYSRVSAIKILCLTLAFLTTESFIFLSMSLLIIGIALKKFAPKDFFYIVASGGLFFVVRQVLAIWYDHFPSKIDFTWIEFLDRAERSFFHIFSIEFYKVNWVATALLWLASLFLLSKWAYRFWDRKFRLIGFIVAAFLPASYLLLLLYSASRAAYGMQILYVSLIVASIYLFAALDAKRPAGNNRPTGQKCLSLLAFVPTKAILILFLLAITVGQGRVLKVKFDNSRSLRAFEEKFYEQLALKGESRIDEIDFDPRSAVGNDWVLPDWALETYKTWLLLKK
ncbi:MAG: hypothetical protein COT74_11315 [Bdellovibrionales bacterium CG10_big_fil_rev_8_21_14_0_10_45_34]|nr:MAG: hypothetical protein COT74_11315 [Bdellovibrionales bacterium CG10_big_fil_rev_8_21_14_0_10_45_34]